MLMAMPEETPAGTVTVRNAFRLQEMAGAERRAGLVAESGAHGYALAADGATAAQDGSAALGLHPCAEAMCFHAVTAIGLKCALGHGIALLFPFENLRLDGKT
jgi:hypothetical protein